MSTFSQEELPRLPKDDGFFEGADLLPDLLQLNKYLTYT